MTTPLHRSALQHGHIYQCRLSGLSVLVCRSITTAPDPQDPRRQKTSEHIYGWMYNPVYGTYQKVDLHHYQLVPIPGEQYPERIASLRP
jgi:hypothetical protein